MSKMQPKLYHAHHQLYLEDLPFWQALAAQQAGNSLELGCGTGRILLPLHQAGLQIYGLDLNYEMLAILKAENSAVRVLQANLLEFHLDTKYNLIFLPCNTWSTFSAKERQQALNSIDRHLAPSGIFTASMPNPDILLDLEDSDSAETEDSFLHPETGNPVQVSSEWEIDHSKTGQHRVTFFWHYDHLLPDGGLERVTHSTRHSVEPASTFIEEFQGKNWRVNTWGDFEKHKYDTSSPYLIISGKKM